jgi:hypothetical protein
MSAIGVSIHHDPIKPNETHQKMDGQQETNMSLDNTSHPGRPAHDELVPSRYALRVGEIDALVVSDGVLSLPGAMLAHNADPAGPGGLVER